MPSSEREAINVLKLCLKKTKKEGMPLSTVRRTDSKTRHKLLKGQRDRDSRQSQAKKQKGRADRTDGTNAAGPPSITEGRRQPLVMAREHHQMANTQKRGTLQITSIRVSISSDFIFTFTFIFSLFSGMPCAFPFAPCLEHSMDGENGKGHVFEQCGSQRRATASAGLTS